MVYIRVYKLGKNKNYKKKINRNGGGEQNDLNLYDLYTI